VQRNGSGRRAPNRRPTRSAGPCAGVTTATTPRSRCRARSTCSARRILEELRRRFGENFRPQLELEYIERLLRDY
jgi:Domain of unknown function (DUF4175)